MIYPAPTLATIGPLTRANARLRSDDNDDRSTQPTQYDAPVFSLNASCTTTAACREWSGDFAGALEDDTGRRGGDVGRCRQQLQAQILHSVRVESESVNGSTLATVDCASAVSCHLLWYGLSRAPAWALDIPAKRIHIQQYSIFDNV